MGSWIARQLAAGPTLPSGVRMRYAVLLPDGVNTRWDGPVVFWLHTNDAGNQSYPNGNPVDVAMICGADKWFNNAAYQSRYRSIVVVPSCDQTTDNGGTTQNFGGYGPVNAVNEQSLPLIAAEVLSVYGGDPNRVYGAGGSLGGIACWGLALDHNAYNGTFSRTFAALMPQAGMLVRDGVTPATAGPQLSQVPIFAIHGAGDTTSPIGWDDAVSRLFSGNNQPAGPPSGARAGVSLFWYLRDPNLGHDTWDTYVPTGAGAPAWDWLFQQAANKAVPALPPPTQAASPDGTAIPPAATIYATGVAWTITAGQQVAVNGFPDSTTKSVTKLLYSAGRVYQQNAGGGWWSKAAAFETWLGGAPPGFLPPPPPPPTTTTGNFTIRGGRIYRPDGNDFVARGINLLHGKSYLGFDNVAEAVTDLQARPLTTWLPGINCVRIACEAAGHTQDFSDAGDSPASLATAISRLTANGIYCIIECHAGGNPTFTGAQLASIAAWYADCARYYRDNPWVGFGTINEPGSNSSPMDVAIYNAIRGTGSQALLGISAGIGSNGSRSGTNGLTPSSYTAMTGIWLDQHYYGWMNGTNTLAAQTDELTARVNNLTGYMRSADGVLPVIVGEFGNSTDGNKIDANGDNVVLAVQKARAAGLIRGSLAWCWRWVPQSDDAGDHLVLNNLSGLTAFGTQIAKDIASVLALPPPPPPPTPTGPSKAQMLAGAAVISTALAALIADMNRLP